ncbi:hypothetical protein CPB84DRAFT_1035692 [Gymnopilus junonius]|uniref:Uncharacterized protein n=1 Tax=Gymnopilus junonius TaxID=109634 RepID=A0A9P5NPD0_GYMJU|nr:hypothetical protein CPB84DRAFT_1035692 [Gymnopilus junonius]
MVDRYEILRPSHFIQSGLLLSFKKGKEKIKTKAKRTGAQQQGYTFDAFTMILACASVCMTVVENEAIKIDGGERRKLCAFRHLLETREKRVCQLQNARRRTKYPDKGKREPRTSEGMTDQQARFDFEAGNATGSGTWSNIGSKVTSASPV